MIKLIIIFNKPTGSVWFRFYKLETEKTEHPNRKKKTEKKKIRAKPGKTEPVGLNYFCF
jgi:hypothetical protein